MKRHPDYRHDSVLSKRVIDDLLIELHGIAKGEVKDENFKPVFELRSKNEEKILANCCYFAEESG